MAKPFDLYSVEMVHEFYANYATILENMTHLKKDKDMRMQPLLDSMIVRGVKVDISEKMIFRILHGVDFDVLQETQ